MDIEQVSYTKFRMHLASFINQVAKSNLPLLVVRRNNEPAYLVSKEMYEYLVKQVSDKPNNDTKTKSLPQKPVQITANVQQELF